MQQHGNYFARSPILFPHSGDESIGQILTFSTHGHVAYQIKGNHAATWKQIFPRRQPLPHTTLWHGVQGHNFTFSEHGHVAHQIEGNHNYRNMVVNILIAGLTPIDPMDGLNRSKSNFIDNGHAAYQIKGNHECSNMVANILNRPLQIPSPLTLESKGQNSIFSEYGHVS